MKSQAKQRPCKIVVVPTFGFVLVWIKKGNMGALNYIFEGGKKEEPVTALSLRMFCFKTDNTY
jgi:hypothetical protein